MGHWLWFAVLLIVLLSAGSTHVVAQTQDQQTCEHALGQEAIDACTRIINTDRNAAWAYTIRGVAWANKGDFDKAIGDFNKALEINPRDTDAYKNRGLAWASKRHFDKSIADYDKALEIDTKHSPSYYARGVALEATGDLHRSLADFQKVVQLAPYDVTLYTKQSPITKDLDASLAIARVTDKIEMTAKMVALKTELSQSESTRSQLTQKLATSDAVTKELEAKVARTESSLRARESDVTTLKSELTQGANTRSQLTQKLASSESTTKELEVKVAQLNAKATELTRQLSAATKQAEQLKNYLISAGVGGALFLMLAYFVGRRRSNVTGTKNS